MIIQRITKGIKEQDWFVVSVEILIVVIGIFVGLQVTEWNETRKEALEETDYLNRLVIELEDTIQENEAQVKRGHVCLAMAESALSLLINNNLTPETMEQFEKGLDGFDHFSTATIQNTVISEMVSTGKIGIIQSPEVKKGILDYEDSVSTIKANNQGHFMTFLDVRKTLFEHLIMEGDYKNNGTFFDKPEDIIGNRELLGNLLFTHEFSTVQLEEIESYIFEAKEMRKTILNYLGRDFKDIPPLPKRECDN